MSAADPAHNGPRRPATVLHLFKDRAPVRLGKRRDRRDREAPVVESDDETTPHQKLADSAERAFLAKQRTLTDPDTEEAYLITLGIFGTMVDGALDTGIVDEDAHRDLQAILEGLKAAPRLL